jgi:hypothetical protein
LAIINNILPYTGRLSFNKIVAKKVEIGIDKVTPILPTKVRTISVTIVSLFIAWVKDTVPDGLK